MAELTPAPGHGGEPERLARAGRPPLAARRETFSREAREEVAHRPPSRACCRKAFLAALLAGEGRATAAGFELRTRSAALARLALQLLKAAGVASTWECSTVLALGKSNVYRIRIPELAPELLEAAEGSRRCCRRAWLAGWFASSGSVSPPRGGYHLEWTMRSEAHAGAVERALRAEELAPHRMVRRGLHVVSLKRADDVAQVLTLVGATTSLLQFEEVRAMKETRNDLRRRVNAETANLERTSRAAARQRGFLRLLEAHGRLEGLPPGLAEVARLRLRHQELSLREIGERLIPPLTRATVGRKLAQLERMAMALGDPLPASGV